MQQATQAGVYLHSLNPLVYHRDINSTNFLVSFFSYNLIVKVKSNLHLLLSDFGIARESSDPIRDICGSMTHCAPELYLGYPYTEKQDHFFIIH